VRAPARTQATPADAIGRDIDAVFARYTPDGPGCAMGVFQNGRIVFAKGYGLANIEYDVPLSPRTPMIMGSVTKQFTAAAIALLVEQGRLSLDDDVHKYVPELADYGQPITVRQLVHHTSGIRDWWASSRPRACDPTTATRCRTCWRWRHGRSISTSRPAPI
jgi:CubicO group peptidase (beta-lactamase class C family)